MPNIYNRAQVAHLSDGKWVGLEAYQLRESFLLRQIVELKAKVEDLEHMLYTGDNL